MGIFSSKQQSSEATQEQVAQQREETRRRLEWDRLRLAQLLEQRQKQQASLEGNRFRLENATFYELLVRHKVTPNMDFLSQLAISLGEQPLRHYPTNLYQEKELPEQSSLFNIRAMLFKTTNKNIFSISKITCVENIFTSIQYNLAKKKYQTVYNENINESLMFHGTKLENVAGICTYNFDRTKIRTHKFGHGISFARDAFYATHYHYDNQKKRKKVMVLAKVIVGDSLVIGNEYMTIPHEMSYTSTNNKGSVIVKYDDATYCPVNIIYYEGLHPQFSSDDYNSNK